MRYFIAFLLLSSSNVFALTCDSPSLSEQHRRSKHALLVEVVGARMERHETDVPGIPGDEEIVVTDKRMTTNTRRIVATVRVMESYKGSSPPSELVLTDWYNSPAIIVGGIYLVFTTEANVSLNCNGMRPISATGKEDLRTLRELRSLSN